MITYKNVESKYKGKHRNLTLEQVYDWDNLKLAEKDARRGKSRNYGVRKFHKKYMENLLRLQKSLIDRTFKTMTPNFEERYCDNGKLRVLSKVNYEYHIVHHAVMNVIMPTLDKSYYYESAASIKNRGIHYAAKHVRKFVDRNGNKTLWWAQIDFVKCYHYISREKLYAKICKTFKDEGIRWLLHDIIYALGDHNGLVPSDGKTGVGIGLYPVQPLVNFYFNDLDRVASSVKNTRVFRYCDNILVIGFSPKAVWECINKIIYYVENELEQPLHLNIGVQKLDDVHPIDFVGYKFRETITGVRTSLKKNFKDKVKKNHEHPELLKPIVASYKGWLEFSNSLKLWRRIMYMTTFDELNNEFKLTSDTTVDANGKRIFNVNSVQLSFIVETDIEVLDFEDGCTTPMGSDRTFVLFKDSLGRTMKFCTSSKKMTAILLKLRELEKATERDLFPFKTTIKKEPVAGGKFEYKFA